MGPLPPLMAPNTEVVPVPSVTGPVKFMAGLGTTLGLRSRSNTYS